MIPYVNSMRAHDRWWKVFRILCLSVVFLITHNLELIKLKVIILTILSKNYRKNCACVVSGIAEGTGKWWSLASGQTS